MKEEGGKERKTIGEEVVKWRKSDITHDCWKAEREKRELTK